MPIKATLPTPIHLPAQKIAFRRKNATKSFSKDEKMWILLFKANFCISVNFINARMVQKMNVIKRISSLRPQVEMNTPPKYRIIFIKTNRNAFSFSFALCRQIIMTLLVGCAFALPAQQQQQLQRQQKQPAQQQQKQIQIQQQRQLRQTDFDSQPTTEPIPILRQEQEVNFDGTYKWAYETGQCAKPQKIAQIVPTNSDNNI